MKEKEQEQTENEPVVAQGTEAPTEVEVTIVEEEASKEELSAGVEREEEEEEEEGPEAIMAQLEEEKQQLNRRLLRAHADLENFKKRSIRERQESIRHANKEIFLHILQVLDNFERAMLSVQDPKDNFVVGISMIQKQLTEVLTQHGVEEIKAMGRPFDPYLHEAIAMEESSEHEENTVIEEFQKGFRFHGSLLRATKVKVAVAPKETEPALSEEAEATEAEATEAEATEAEETEAEATEVEATETEK